MGRPEGLPSHSPISEESTLKRSKPAQRTRRLTPAEETPLLAATGALTRGAGVRLSGLIIAAIETGARLGELLALQWLDVDLSKRTLLIRAVAVGAKKTGRPREVPISMRLAAVLEMVKSDPARREYPATAYVFGLLGGPVTTIKQAWETSVLRAYGHEPI